MFSVNQLTAGGTYPHEDCGESCVISILHDEGIVTTEKVVETFDYSDNDNPADGTGGRVHSDFLKGKSIGNHVVSGDSVAMINIGRAQGLNRWMLAIWSNSNGDPYTGVGRLGHWVLTDGIQVMNPVGGRIQDNLGACLGAQQRYGVQIDQRIGGQGPRGTVTVGAGQTLHIRQGPGTSYPITGNLSEGEVVEISCQTHGTSVSGMWGVTSLWDKTSGGFVSDGFVNTGTNGQVAPTC
jgi:hypothetical protein